MTSIFMTCAVTCVLPHTHPVTTAAAACVQRAKSALTSAIDPWSISLSWTGDNKTDYKAISKELCTKAEGKELCRLPVCNWTKQDIFYTVYINLQSTTTYCRFTVLRCLPEKRGCGALPMFSVWLSVTHMSALVWACMGVIPVDWKTPGLHWQYLEANASIIRSIFCASPGSLKLQRNCLQRQMRNTTWKRNANVGHRTFT